MSELFIKAVEILCATAIFGFVGSYLAKWFSPKVKEGDVIFEIKRQWYQLSKVEWSFVALNLIIGGYILYPDIPTGLIAGSIAAVTWYLILTIPNLFKKP